MEYKTREELEAKLRDRATELSLMNELCTVLLSTLNLDEILQMILIGTTAYQALGFNRSFLFLINEKETFLEGKLATGSLSAEDAYSIWGRLAGENLTLKELLKSRHGELSKDDVPINNLVKQLKVPLKGKETIFTQAVYQNKTFNITNGSYNTLIDKDFITLLGTDCFALVPLISRKKPLGVLLADNFINRKPIGNEEVERLRTFANLASIAIENSNLYKNLEEKIHELSTAYNEIRENRDKLIRYERLSAMGKVAAKITHEIRNPLVSIGGFARRILKKDPGEEINRNYIKIIVEEIERLESILSDFLNFAKPAALACETAALNSMIESTIKVLSSEIEKGDIHVETQFDAAIPPLLIDENQIRRVVINLVRNALEAMPEGGTLSIATLRDRQWVRIEIADTGVGISDEDRDRIFDAFFTSKTTGSGLGLTISAQIINAHDGTIEVSRRKPKGTIFTIRLPIKNPLEKVIIQ